MTRENNVRHDTKQLNLWPGLRNPNLFFRNWFRKLWLSLYLDSISLENQWPRMRMPTEKNGSKKLFVMWEAIPANLKQVSEPPNHPILISKSPLPTSKLKFSTKNLQRKRN